MAKRSFHSGSVALEGWGSSVMSTAEYAECTPTRRDWWRGKPVHGDLYGKRFADSDAAWRAMREHGYSQPHQRSRVDRFRRMALHQAYGMRWYRGHDAPRYGAFPAIPNAILAEKCRDFGPCRRLTAREQAEWDRLMLAENAALGQRDRRDGRSSPGGIGRQMPGRE